MKIRKLVLFLIPTLLYTALFNLPIQGGQKEGELEEIFIPEQVKMLIEQGLAAREPQLDIPFEISQLYFLPAQQNIHAVFMFTVKNEALDFKPIAQAIEEALDETQAEVNIQEKEPEILQANFKIFLSIFERGRDRIGQTVRESYVPGVFQESVSTFAPETEHSYSIGYPLPPGDYLLALAITSIDLSKIGLQYYEFSLPDAMSFRQSLGMTPIIFIKSLQRLEQPEMTTQVHRDSFVYSTLKIFPKKTKVFTSAEAMDIMYFVFGSIPQERSNQFSIQANYEIKKAGESVLKFEEQTFTFPFISHPLPLLQEEDKPFVAGTYTLEVMLKDSVSGRSLRHSVEFEVK